MANKPELMISEESARRLLFDQFVDFASNHTSKLLGSEVFFILNPIEGCPSVRVGGVVSETGIRGALSPLSLYIRFIGGSEISFTSFDSVECIESTPSNALYGASLD